MHLIVSHGHHHRKGFTFIELAIVIVILGLLTGGVLTGQSLIRAAELRSISTQYQQYTTAVTTFREKYFKLPGDLNNAASFWTGCVVDPNVANNTCNGNGNGSVDAVNPNTEHEDLRFWQHLALAGLVEGDFDGHWVSATQPFSVGDNMPAARYGNHTFWFQDAEWDSPIFGRDGNNFIFAAPGGATDREIVTSTLSPEEAWNIDSKIDDGVAHTGAVYSFNDSGNCSADYDTSGANYNLSNQTATCVLVFWE
jgi:prepilin-type N-terminal cleavage/methylation domain-containing protein